MTVWQCRLLHFSSSVLCYAQLKLRMEGQGTIVLNRVLIVVEKKNISNRVTEVVNKRFDANRFSVLTVGGHITDYCYPQNLGSWSSTAINDLLVAEIKEEFTPRATDIIEEISIEVIRKI